MPKQEYLVQVENLMDLLGHRASFQPDKTAYRFLPDRQKIEPEEITYSELSEKVRSLASVLIENGLKPNDRVLINDLPGIRYIISFFATLYAGGVAVPVYPPRFNARMDRLAIIIRDSGAKISLTSSLVTRSMTATQEEDVLNALRWVETDTCLDNLPAAGDFRKNVFKTDDLAFLQYTSGSTSDPKGVMLTHKSLLSNLKCIHHKFQINPEIDQGVIWLPPYHDMGFIGGILVPLYSGFPVTLMSPLTFIQRPIRWLEAISKYKGTISGGPNFSYEQCVRRIRDEAIQELDLSSWRVAFCGAEPIHPGMMERFTEKFSSTGFQKKMFYPCYGLAEATLIVTGGDVESEPRVFHTNRKKLEDEHIALLAAEEAGEVKDGGRQNRVRRIVGCGSVVPDHDLKVVDYQTKRLCQDGQIGEIWVSGDSIARGYWMLPEETERTFGATYFGQQDEKKYLQTGDLGFIKDDEVYITGRIKDVMIIRGKNFYPQDIEVSVGRSHELIKPGAGVVFSVPIKGEEYLVVLSELAKEAHDENCDDIIDAIESCIFEDHGLSLAGIQLLKPGSIPFTSSGKVMRQASRKIFLESGFEAIKTKGIQSEEII